MLGVPMLPADNPTRVWHALSTAEVTTAVAGRLSGLSQAEAALRLTTFGPNQLPQQPPPTWWQIVWRQFQSPLIYILVAAAVVAMLGGDFKDAVFIGLVLVINAAIGGYQEWRAERSSRALQQLLQIRATVLRDGELREISAQQLVPGDVVSLESGNRVPADMRLLTTHGLEVDESLLTGESLAVTKDAEWLGEANAPVSDRLNLAYAASIVVRGRAKGIVIGTGTGTEVGKLAVDVLAVAGGRPPLLERMEKFSQALAYGVSVAVVLVAIMGVALHGYSWHEMFLFGVALAVSAIPEGLPAALTVALAVAATRMARRGVIVRRLAAVEGLGSCTLIASDKTGTLTCNELTVREIHLPGGERVGVSGQGFAPAGEIQQNGQPLTAAQQAELAALVQVAVLCNEATLQARDDAWVWQGDPTDVALLSLGHKAGVARVDRLAEWTQLSQIPFEPERQYAATFHESHDQRRVFLKGAPERVLAMCDWQGQADRQAAMSAMAEAMAAEGFRVLGLADGPVSEVILPTEPAGLAGLTFRGFVGMIDPLREGVREAVGDCHRAGIQVCMVTGDHPVTALAISRDLGLADRPDQVVTGAELADKTSAEIQLALQRGRVFARVAPRQKLELVDAARAAGHFVAVTGDGVNDAPALRAANIGVAMGKGGTDVAREAAELVISDDNFATIVSGIEEGRIAYDNVRKVIYLLVSTGAAEVLLIALAFAIGSFLPLPFLPVQLLWLNLVTNGLQGIALAFEPGESGVLQRRPRRPSEPIFDQLMIERTVVAALTMAAVGVGAFAWMKSQAWSDEAARNGLLLLLVLFETVHLGNCRSERRSAWTLSPLRSPWLMVGAMTALAVHALAMHWPFLQSLLRTEPVSLTTWATMALLALSVLATMELHKWSWRRRFPEAC